MMDSLCGDRPPRPRLEPEGESGQPKRPVKDLYSRGPLPIQLGHPRIGTKADAPSMSSVLHLRSEDAGPPREVATCTGRVTMKLEQDHSGAGAPPFAHDES